MIQSQLQKGSGSIVYLPAIQPVALQTDSRLTSTPGTFLGGWLVASYGLEFLWS